MISVGGGGGPGLPMGGPVETLITVAVLAGVVWLAYKIFS